tara:strand:+ start:3115 stop:3255 length:141 start_codon:yes stop_codon:yes gene_type:complete
VEEVERVLQEIGKNGWGAQKREGEGKEKGTEKRKVTKPVRREKNAT